MDSQQHPFFLMGRYKAICPADVGYFEKHFWARKEDGGLKIGLTSYIQRFYLDVIDLTFEVKEGDEVALEDPVVAIEGMKAVNTLGSPVKGRIAGINKELLDNPSLVNASPYDQGWIIHIATDDDPPMDHAAYIAMLEVEWPATLERVAREKEEARQKLIEEGKLDEDC